MTVRSLRPVDLVALASFGSQAAASEVTSRTWPGSEPGSGAFPIFTLGRLALMRQPGKTRAWIAHGDDGVGGLLMARPRANALAWDVERFYLRPGMEDLAAELVERAARHAGEHGGRRVFLTAPASQPRAGLIARKSGLERYAGMRVYRLAPGFEAEKTDAFQARPRLSSDEQGLFQLYSASEPAPVRAAEAMTHEEWAGLHRGSRRWQPSITGSRQQYVWELGATLVGRLELTFGQRSQLVELQVHPRYEESSDKLLRYTLHLLSPKAPVYATVKEHQAALASALERAGFELEDEHDLYVRVLAARVPEARLLPAKVIGG